MARKTFWLNWNMLLQVEEVWGATLYHLQDLPMKVNVSRLGSRLPKIMLWNRDRSSNVVYVVSYHMVFISEKRNYNYHWGDLPQIWEVIANIFLPRSQTYQTPTRPSERKLKQSPVSGKIISILMKNSTFSCS